MLIQVFGSGFEISPQLRDNVKACLEIALRRFSFRVKRIEVSLKELSEPYCEGRKSLRLIIEIERLPSIIIDEKGDLWQTLLDRAVETSVHTVSWLMHEEERSAT